MEASAGGASASRLGLSSSASHQSASTSGAPSTSGRSSASVSIHGTQVPVDWLVQRHDPKKYPNAVLVTPQQQRQTNKDLQWARWREQSIAAAAAGVHVAMFAFNLAFWGSEGMPPDRYWPSNTRLKMGIKPGRYGNMDGTKRIYFDNLATLEGL